MKRPKSVYMVRRDNTAMICPNCLDRPEGEAWAINQDREILLDFCPKCADKIAQSLKAKEAA